MKSGARSRLSSRSRINCAAFPAIAAILLFITACLVAGCNDEDHIYVDRTPPRPPQGVFTVTGDTRVDIYWLPNCDSDLEGYRVYWNDQPTGYYKYLATTSSTHYTDLDVVNGDTYYYAVSAFDRAENESDLSYETVSDTPRPEGFNLVLYDYNGPHATLSGYVFSTETRQLYSLSTTPATDIYYGYVGGQSVMFTWNPNPEWPLTDIQDAGYRPLIELDEAPSAGWAEDGTAILTLGHSYFVWTRDNHYAKFYVKELQADYVMIDWAYQTAQGNPELVKQKLARSGNTADFSAAVTSAKGGGIVR